MAFNMENYNQQVASIQGQLAAFASIRLCTGNKFSVIKGVSKYSLPF